VLVLVAVVLLGQLLQLAAPATALYVSPEQAVQLPPALNVWPAGHAEHVRLLFSQLLPSAA
jgi:hypothetical protein